MADAKRDTQREVGAVFKDEKAFADAVFSLEAAGFDRADLSALGHEEPLKACLAAADCARQRATSSKAPHEAVLLEDDAQQGRVLFTSLAAAIAALLASGVALAATGGAAAPAFAAAVAAGGSAGGISRFLANRGEQAHAENLKEQLGEGGIVLWTRVTSQEEEDKATTILRRNAAGNVHAHDLS